METRIPTPPGHTTAVALRSRRSVVDVVCRELSAVAPRHRTTDVSRVSSDCQRVVPGRIGHRESGVLGKPPCSICSPA